MSKIKTIDNLAASFLNLCTKKPFSKISMREVARNSDFSHTLLLKYFPNKRILLQHCYSETLNKNITKYESAKNIGELACYMMETWDGMEDIITMFSKAFTEDPVGREFIYKISREILFKEVVRLSNGDSVEAESYYTLLISIAYYPSIMLKNKETSVNIDNYKVLLQSIVVKP